MLAFLRREARWIGTGFLLTFFSGFGQTYFIALSNTAFREMFALSHGTLGLVYALATLASAAILLEFGRIVDRVSTRTAALIVVVGLAGAAALTGLAGSVWMLWLGFVGLRLFGQGMMSQVAMTATGRWFEASRGRAVSLVALGYPASEALFPPIAVALIATLGVREFWLVAALVTLVAAAPVLAVLLSRERVPQGAPGAAGGASGAARRSWRRGEVLQEWSFLALHLGTLCPPFMVTGLFFHQQHLAELKGWSEATFALGFSAFAATAVISGLVTGGLVDRLSARAVLPLYLLPLAAGLILVSLASGNWVIFVMMVLIGLTAGAASTLMGAIWPELFGVAHLGGIRALTFAAMVASTAASPVLTGLLIDAGIAFPLQLGVMGGYAVLASALMGLIQPRLAAIAGNGPTAMAAHSRKP